MPGPFDYSVRPSTPFDPSASLAQGLQMGEGLAEGRRQQLAFQAAQQQDQRKKEAQQAFAALPTDAPLEDLERVRSTYADVLGGTQQVMEQRDAKKKKNEDDRFFSVANLALGGLSDEAIEELGRQAVAMESDPAREKEAAALREMALQIEKDPESMRRVLYNSAVSRDPGRAKMILEWDRLRRQERTETRLENREVALSEKSDAEIDKIREQTQSIIAERKAAKDEADRKAAAKLAGKAADPELTPAQKSSRDAAARTGAGASVTASDAQSLADELRDLGRQQKSGDQGVLARLGEEVKRSVTGELDAVTRARQKYDAFRAAGIMSNLPPGAASDTDVALASKPFPENTRDLEGLSRFMAAVARVEKRAAEVSGFESEYSTRNGGLGPNRKTRSIRGVEIPADLPYDRALSLFLEATPYGLSGKKKQAPQPAKSSTSSPGVEVKKTTRVPFKARVQALKAAGRTREEAMKIMTAEGYNMATGE
jgi:hypothetical protein